MWVIFMRISITKSKNCEFVYVTKDIYSSGKRTTKIYRKLGRMDDLCSEKNMTRDEVIIWARALAKQLTEQDNDENRDVVIPFISTRIIDRDAARKFNCGYLFIQKIMYELRIDAICRKIKERHDFQFSLESILTDLVYARILCPSSKKSSYDFASTLLEKPKYELHDVYRALDILEKESDFIQSELYRNSQFIRKRNTSALYYDCTNYYFEIEEDDDFRKYGKGKEHRPNPIVGMGLFMDGDGIPLAFSTYPGNRNEQLSLRPLEEKIISDFELSKFIYCSDAGLASRTNKKFNSLQDRAYIITQSLKKLKGDIAETALRHTGFCDISKPGRPVIDIDSIDFSRDGNMDRLFYKDIPVDSPLEERLIVTYSPKYAMYQKNIRRKQVERAANMIVGKGKIKKTVKNPNDPARFIQQLNVTENGEAVDARYILNTDRIREEEKYDGFYAVATNLQDDDVSSILAISERRWQIEECFRIMKTDFRARPVYLQKKERIEAHFLTCFISLIAYRFLCERLENRYTVNQILHTLRDMEVVDTQYNGYIPAYTRTELTDMLHEKFEFRTDYEIIGKKKMRNIIKITKEK